MMHVLGMALIIGGGAFALVVTIREARARWDQMAAALSSVWKEWQ